MASLFDLHFLLGGRRTGEPYQRWSCSRQGVLFTIYKLYLQCCFSYCLNVFLSWRSVVLVIFNRTSMICEEVMVSSSSHHLFVETVKNCSNSKVLLSCNPIRVHILKELKGEFLKVKCLPDFSQIYISSTKDLNTR